jgi:hypothetical protein
VNLLLGLESAKATVVFRLAAVSAFI